MTTFSEFLSAFLPREKHHLILIFIGVFVLHVSAFFFLKLQPSYPSITLKTQPTAYILPLSKSTAVSTWIQLFDPTVIALPSTEPSSETLPKEPLSPHLQQLLTQPSTSPIASDIQPTQLPETRPSLQLRASEALTLRKPNPEPIVVEAPPHLSGTKTRIVGSLSQRTLIQQPSLPQPRTSLALQPTTLRIAVDPEGSVIHTLLEESSGDSSIDTLGLDTLKTWRFTPLPEIKAPTLQWGRVNIFWDTQPPLPSSTPQTTPSP